MHDFSDPVFRDGYVKMATLLGMEKSAVFGWTTLPKWSFLVGALGGLTAGAGYNYMKDWSSTPTDDDIAILEDKALIEEMRRTQDSLGEYREKRKKGKTPRDVKPLRGFDI